MGFCSLALLAREHWCFCNSYQAHDNGTAAANLNSSLLPPNLFSHNVTSFRSYRIMRRSNTVVSIQASKAKSSSSNSNLNIAHLTGRRKEGYVVPRYKHKSWKKYPIHEFLSHPSGIEAILKSDAAQSFQPLGSNNYRLTSQTIQFMNHEVIPVFDLRVITTTKDCTFEMSSCKVMLISCLQKIFLALFSYKDIETCMTGGEPGIHSWTEIWSEYLPIVTNGILLAVRGFRRCEKQSKSFFSIHEESHNMGDLHCSKESKPHLDVEMTLGISFEVSGLPFSLLPLSVVETPGNLLIQAQVDNHARQVLQQLLLHYDKWVRRQCQVSP